MLTSICVLEKTGISRATLNNYIHMGLLPKPIVRKNEDPAIRARRVGYFPRTVLDIIQNIFDMKARGTSMKNIVEFLTEEHTPQSGDNLKNKNDVKFSMQTGSKGSLQEELFPTKISGNLHYIDQKSKSSIICNELTLSFFDLPHPAYLVNDRYEIVWINEQAIVKIFMENVVEFNKRENVNIFHLLFEKQYIKDEIDLHTLAEMHMSFLKARCLRSFIGRLYRGISDEQQHLLEYLYDRVEASSAEVVQQSLLDCRDDDGEAKKYLTYNILSMEGVLFIFFPIEKQNSYVKKRISIQRSLVEKNSGKESANLISYSVIVAKLQDTERIFSALPVSHFFSLRSKILQVMDEVFKKYHGFYGRSEGSGIVYYFPENKDSSHLISPLVCSLKIREDLSKLKRHFSLHQEVVENVHINMGIDEGRDYIDFSKDWPDGGLAPMNETVHRATLLADFALFGSIWTTKNLIDQLAVKELDRIRFGVHLLKGDSTSFRENRFSRIMDLFETDVQKYSKFEEIVHLAVAEIYEKTSQNPSGEIS